MDVSDSDCYRYKRFKPGENIRLLEIEDAVGDDTNETIISHLRHACLEKLDDVFMQGSRKKAYEALSYAWGPTYPDDSHLSDIIVCDGEPLKVTAHLNLCLKAYRETRKRRQVSKYLWVDAICINQRKLSEKNAHVQRMDRVYHEAQCTVIYLGDLDSHSLERLRRTLAGSRTGTAPTLDDWLVWREVLDMTWYVNPCKA